MVIISQITVSLVWGQLGTLFFYRGWMAFLGVACTLLGFCSTRTCRRTLVGLLFDSMTRSICYGLMLSVLFAFLYCRWGYGRTEMETLVFLVSATTRLAVVLPRISEDIDSMWRRVFGPD